jgi:hypothetical protein
MTRKQTRTAGDVLLQLTEPDRKSIVKFVRLKRSLKQKIEQAGDGTKVLRLSKNEVDALHADIAMGALYAVDPHRKRLVSVQEVLAEILDPEGPAGGAAARRRSSNKPSGLIYQFKITLLHTEPPIWRQILVRDGTLEDLHEHIQIAMGWSNSHLHQFQIGGRQYRDHEFMDFDEDDFVCGDSTRTLLSAVLPTDGQSFRFEYLYDFGDNWEHEVLFEGAANPEPGIKYPVCTAGAMACPPDDVGGVWGFEEYLEALADAKNERHDELLDWGGPFDPKAFEAAKATKAMRRGLPHWPD